MGRADLANWMIRLLPLLFVGVALASWRGGKASSGTRPGADGAAVITKACVESKPTGKNSKLAKALEKVQTQFKNQSQRVKAPEAFVAALDEVIAGSSFGSLLKCREALADSGLTYKLMFQDPEEGDRSMSVQTTGSNEIVLNFNLTKSVQRVLFVYIHELNHVCQIPEAYGYRNDGDYVRFKLFGEVESFYKMGQAYKELVQESNRLCKAEGLGSDRKEPPLFESYLNNEKELANGSFAPFIISGYLANYQGYEDEIVAKNGTLHQYETLGLREGFSLPSLHPKLKGLIEERLGIEIREP